MEVFDAPEEDRPGRDGVGSNQLWPAPARHLCGRSGGGEFFRDHCARINRQALNGASTPEEVQAHKMSEQKFPAGWGEEKVRSVVAFYDTQTEDEALIEDEAGWKRTKRSP